MKIRYLSIVIVALLSISLFSGCFEKEKNNDNIDKDSDTTTIDNPIIGISKIVYDNDKFEINNFSVETIGYNDYLCGKVGDGFLDLPDRYGSGKYFIDGTVKNIAGYELEKVDVTSNFYDKNDNLLPGSGTTQYRKDGPMGSICNGCAISLNQMVYSNTTNWEKYDHMEILLTIIE